MNPDTRTQILFGVWQVIAEGGLAGVSMRSVAAAAGVSLGSVQHHFGTKQELIRASAAAMIQGAEDRHHTKEALPAARRLLELIGHSIPVAENSRRGTSVFYAYVAASVSDPAIAGIIADAKRGVLTEVASLLGELGVDDSPDPALHLLAVGDGLAMNVLLGTVTAAQASAALAAEVERVLSTPSPASLKASRIDR